MAPSQRLVCEKWQTCPDGRHECSQSSSQPCGCQSAVIKPTVNAILNDDQKDSQERYIAGIKKHIREDQAALVLGAGISKPSKMPLWGGLISKMMGYAIQYDQLGKHEFSNVKTSGATERASLLKLSRELTDGDLQLLGKVNTLESAEYVAQLFDTRVDSARIRRKLEEEAIHGMVKQLVDNSLSPTNLLQDPEDGLPGAGSEIAGGKTAAQGVDDAGPRKVAARNTMFAVSYLMAEEHGIHCAMSYNYDPLVQEHMLDLYRMDETQLLTHPGLWGTHKGGDGVRELYHVHGFVPGERQLARGSDRVFPNKSGPLVLSEDSYYRIEREEAYNWSSSIQSYFLNRYHCVFVGFSADDYNFRRILRQMGDKLEDGEKHRHWHYLIMTIDDWIGDVYADVCRARAWKSDGKLTEPEVDGIAKEATLLLRYVLNCRAAYWSRFNICPIWVTVKDIPNLLVNLIPTTPSP